MLTERESNYGRTYIRRRLLLVSVEPAVDGRMLGSQNNQRGRIRHRTRQAYHTQAQTRLLHIGLDRPTVRCLPKASNLLVGW